MESIGQVLYEDSLKIVDTNNELVDLLTKMKETREELLKTGLRCTAPSTEHVVDAMRARLKKQNTETRQRKMKMLTDLFKKWQYGERFKYPDRSQFRVEKNQYVNTDLKHDSSSDRFLSNLFKDFLC